MVSITHLTDEAAVVLAYLWELDTRAGGYTRRGVRGWARREDVEAATGLALPELLPRLRGRGLVAEDQVQPRGTRPIAVYRITSLGDLFLSRFKGREPRPPWPAGEPGEDDQAVYLAPSVSLALKQLREALQEGTPSRFGSATAGWRTEQELWESWHSELGPSVDGDDPWLPGDLPWQAPEARAAGASSESPVIFDRTDLVWLERAGLAERWLVTPPGRVRPVTLWRVSERGIALTELEWHRPR
jgi:hypothetical protein